DRREVRVVLDGVTTQPVGQVQEGPLLHQLDGTGREVLRYHHQIRDRPAGDRRGELVRVAVARRQHGREVDPQALVQLLPPEVLRQRRRRRSERRLERGDIAAGSWNLGHRLVRGAEGRVGGWHALDGGDDPSFHLL